MTESSSSKVPLSAIILTHRLDQRFRQALRSVQFATEIIVVSDLPPNKTKLLKQWQSEFEFKLIKLKQKLSNFSQVRQEATRQAKRSWVLFLDSDEELEETSIEQIRDFTQQKRYAGVLVKRQDFFLGQALQYGEVSQVKLLRLAQKDKLEWQRPVHEQATVDGQVTNSKIRLIHHAHASLTEFIQDVAYYTQLEAQYRQQQGEKFSLGQLLFYPPAKFIYNYFFRLGLLDGWRGLIYALVMSLHSLAVRAFQFELALPTELIAPKE